MGTISAQSGLNLLGVKQLEILERACYISSMMTTLSHVDPTANLNRWYLVSVQATLFSPYAVVIAWGRRDTEFQQWRALPAESPSKAEQLAAKIIQHKLRRGYRVYPGQE